jgi:hypothetical protein
MGACIVVWASGLHRIMQARTPAPQEWLYTLRGKKLHFSCHSERSEESLLPAAPAQKFFTPLCSVQNDNPWLLGVQKRSPCPWAV